MGDRTFAPLEVSNEQALMTGTRGAGTEGSGLVEANNDREAVLQWLLEYRQSPKTLRHYRKEAERFVLWLEAQALTLNNLKRSHIDAFDRFLEDPQPASVWVGPTRPRHHPTWRPFRGGLSPASRRQALVILQSLMSWLQQGGWVRHNPFSLIRDRARRFNNSARPVERYFERDQWAQIWTRLNRPHAEQGDSRERFEAQRLRFMFGFAYLLAPRISEMSQARMNDFFLHEGQWWWQVVGKGDKWARLPVPADMMALLGQWRAALELPPEPGPMEDAPVLRALDGKRGLSDNQLYRLFKQAYSALADELDASTPDEQRLVQRLRAATPHWLRHTSLTHQAQAGIELRYLALNARHARLETTARYLHAESDEWQQQQSRHGLTTDVP
ncbi:tyrosine-type recombinase/integrase [Larsenimonas suaedae]|uniref:Site-specific integrase n=1 Tax=Larsenimonas suaedae TaxID=1851019 RepID=A0ABU1GWX1_9GAMM|nr:site-specific integrase [Larsenimonas suaedae]MCM2971335.1 site-specific integrase [Larsenimonas suaedae]MDR5896046.1 site-specific integrase [Larsenimonas suaedae]